MRCSKSSFNFMRIGLLVIAVVSCSHEIDDHGFAIEQTMQKAPGPEYFFSRKNMDGTANTTNLKQNLQAELGKEGLKVRPIQKDSWFFTLRFSRIGRVRNMEAAPAVLSQDVQVANNRATLVRQGNIEEWYLNTPSGIEHGFVIPDKPEVQNKDLLLLDLEVLGNLKPRLVTGEKKVQLINEKGNTVLNYSELWVKDAQGKWLDAQFEVEDNVIRLRIDDTDARYPLEIDPLIWTESKRITAGTPEDLAHFGWSVSMSGDIAIVGVAGENVGGTNRGAAYIFYRHQGGVENWGQVKRLTAGTLEDSANFGWSVSISGDVVIVGTASENVGGTKRGAAYIFSRNQGGSDNWGQVKKLTAGTLENWAYFGYSVSISGDDAIIGAYGENVGGTDRGTAYIFNRNQGGSDNWGQVKKLTASTPEDWGSFGYSVSISGDDVIVGAYAENGGGGDRGAAYIFNRNQGGANNWGQVKKLAAGTPEDLASFGWSVSIFGDDAIVGAYAEDVGGSDRGAAYIFGRDQGGADNWGQVKKLTASTLENGAAFGYSVSISGDDAIVGAYTEDVSGTDRGAAYMFGRDQGGADNWGQLGKLTPSVPENLANFGYSVANSNGDNAIVGAPYENASGTERGAAYIFKATSKPNGASCIAHADCASGYCIDSVCCDTVCGSGNTVDCQVCSIATGASADGTCTNLTGVPCMDGSFCNGTDTCLAGACSVHTGDPCPGPDGDSNCVESCNEAADNCTANDTNGSSCNDSVYCNGTETCLSGACSVHTGDPCVGPDSDNNCIESCNEAADNCTEDDPNGSSCNDGVYCNGTETCLSGACSVHTGDPCSGPDNDTNCAESCNETADNCTSYDTAGSVCRAVVGDCDIVETCTGTNSACPTDTYKSAGTVCRFAMDECDLTEICSGSSGVCPANSYLSDGTLCNNGLSTCVGGLCAVITPDSGPIDQGIIDSTTIDANIVDASTTDAGIIDGVTVDAASEGLVDISVDISVDVIADMTKDLLQHDGGVDAALKDAIEIDTQKDAVEFDALKDAIEEIDAQNDSQSTDDLITQTDAVETPPKKTGCSCEVSSFSSDVPVVWLGLMILFIYVRRCRRGKTS